MHVPEGQGWAYVAFKLSKLGYDVDAVYIVAAPLGPMRHSLATPLARTREPSEMDFFSIKLTYMRY